MGTEGKREEAAKFTLQGDGFANEGWTCRPEIETVVSWFRPVSVFCGVGTMTHTQDRGHCGRLAIRVETLMDNDNVAGLTAQKHAQCSLSRKLNCGTVMT